MTNTFRTTLGENVFRIKYAQGPDDSWRNLAIRCVDDVCGQSGKLTPILSKDERAQLVEYITSMKFIPGGRYLYLFNPTPRRCRARFNRRNS